MTTSKLVATVARHLSPYLEMHRLSGERYYFRKESTALRDVDGNRRVWHPRIEHSMLRDFHTSATGVLYVALAKSVNLHEIQLDDLLYIGCSSSGGSRFWRGRPTPSERFSTSKSCFHHEQMRRGRDGSNLENYLIDCGPVVLHTMTDDEVLRMTKAHGIPLPTGRYPSHQMEKAVLAEGFVRWRWNARA